MTAAHEPLAADRAFLWNLERHSPGLHVGGLARIDGEIEPRELLERAERLGELPRFGLRVEKPPFGGPRWRPARLEPRKHVRVAGRDDPAAALGAALSQPLDPKRPLWELHLLPGFHAGGDALLFKTHPAAVDGLGTGDLFDVLFDSGPGADGASVPERLAGDGASDGDGDGSADANGSSYAKRSDGANADGDANRDGSSYARSIDGSNGSGADAGSMFRPGIDVGRRMAEWVQDWTGAGRDLLGSAVGLASEDARTAFLALSESMPDAALPPVPLPFNGPVRGRRRLIRSELSYADVRRVRARLGGALSDVVLAVVASGLERYLSRRGVPTSRRGLRIALATDVADRGGKRRSLLPVEVPLGVGAAERLRAVRQLTRLLRAARVANALSRFAGLQRATGALAAAGTAAAASVRPPFHLTVANETGPQIPQFLTGRPVVGYTPSWPVGFGQGLSCAFFAYNQLLHVGLTVDERACPDGDELPDLLAESLEELREAAGSPARRPARSAPPAPAPHADQPLET